MNNIVFIILSGNRISGGEKRTARLFKYLDTYDNKNKYKLIVNRMALKEIEAHGINLLRENVIEYSIPLMRKNQASNISEKLNESKNKVFRKQLSFFWYKFKCLVRFVHLFFFLKEVVKKENIDIVYPLHMNYAMTVSSVLKRLLYNFKLVITYNDSLFLNIDKGVLSNNSSFFMGLKTADIIDFPGKYYYTEIPKRGIKIKKEKIYFSPCSFVDIEDINAFHKENIVVFAHRFIQEMNPILFIESAKIVTDSISNVKFAMLGYGEMEDRIQMLIKEYDLTDNFVVKYTRNISDFLRKSKIFCTLRTLENYHSQSLLEAMYTKNAIIASNVGDTKNIINKDTGFLVEFSASQIAEKIIFLIRNEKIRQKMGMNAFLYVRNNHKIQDYANYFISIFNNIKQ